MLVVMIFFFKGIPVIEPVVSSDEDEPLAPSLLGTEQTEDEGIYPFRRSVSSQYQKVFFFFK